MKIRIIEVMNSDNQWEWQSVIKDDEYIENTEKVLKTALAEYIGEDNINDEYILRHYKKEVKVSAPFNL